MLDLGRTLLGAFFLHTGLACLHISQKLWGLPGNLDVEPIEPSTEPSAEPKSSGDNTPWLGRPCPAEEPVDGKFVVTVENKTGIPVDFQATITGNMPL